jgi:hypothetical protein
MEQLIGAKAQIDYFKELWEQFLGEQQPITKGRLNKMTTDGLARIGSWATAIVASRIKEYDQDVFYERNKDMPRMPPSPENEPDLSDVETTYFTKDLPKRLQMEIPDPDYVPPEKKDKPSTKKRTKKAQSVPPIQQAELSTPSKPQEPRYAPDKNKAQRERLNEELRQQADEQQRLSDDQDNEDDNEEEREPSPAPAQNPSKEQPFGQELDSDNPDELDDFEMDDEENMDEVEQPTEKMEQRKLDHNEMFEDLTESSKDGDESESESGDDEEEETLEQGPTGDLAVVQEQYDCFAKMFNG